LGPGFQPEEQRPRPAVAGDHARDFGQRSIRLAAEHHAALQHRHLMLGSAPLADQKCSWCELAYGRDAYWPPGTRILSHALEQPARCRLETAEHALLHPVGN